MNNSSAAESFWIILAAFSYFKRISRKNTGVPYYPVFEEVRKRLAFMGCIHEGDPGIKDREALCRSL